jgi:hypothetical protein
MDAYTTARRGGVGIPEWWDGHSAVLDARNAKVGDCELVVFRLCIFVCLCGWKK